MRVSVFTARSGEKRPGAARSFGAAAAMAVWAMTAAPGQAALIAYTDSAAFQAAVPGTAATLNFESQAAGTLIPDGGALDGIAFAYPALSGFLTLEVNNTFDTTSGSNYLGTTDGGSFFGGDAFDLSFAPVNALGMFFVTGPSPIFDADLTLTAGGATASLAAADREQVLADGGQVFFLGLIDGAATFTGASVGGSGPFFDFTIDDITTAAAGQAIPVPEPPALPLFALGLLGLWAAARYRRERP